MKEITIKAVVNGFVIIRNDVDSDASTWIAKDSIEVARIVQSMAKNMEYEG